MYGRKRNQSNLPIVCFVVGCALWSVKYGNAQIRSIHSSIIMQICTFRNQIVLLGVQKPLFVRRFLCFSTSLIWLLLAIKFNHLFYRSDLFSFLEKSIKSLAIFTPLCAVSFTTFRLPNIKNSEAIS